MYYKWRWVCSATNFSHLITHGCNASLFRTHNRENCILLSLTFECLEFVTWLALLLLLLLLLSCSCGGSHCPDYSSPYTRNQTTPPPRNTKLLIGSDSLRQAASTVSFLLSSRAPSCSCVAGSFWNAHLYFLVSVTMLMTVNGSRRCFLSPLGINSSYERNNEMNVIEVIVYLFSFF